jgi:hypothetical protein
LVRDDRLEKINDLLLSYGHDVELAAHLGEAIVDMGTKVDEVLPKVDEVLAEGIETCGRGLAEIAKLAAELTDVAVGGLHELSVPAITVDARQLSTACAAPTNSTSQPV